MDNSLDHKAIKLENNKNKYHMADGKKWGQRHKTQKLHHIKKNRKLIKIKIAAEFDIC